MYVPRHEELGIVLQDEHFLDRPRWDFDGTPAERYPLLLHHHPLELYRHQVIKQTDVVLATYLLDRSFSAEEIRRTFEYYDPLTTGDSTLSACVQSIVASAAGTRTPRCATSSTRCSVDLLDSHGNTGDGLHIASCGGTWLALVAGFGGLRDFDGEVRFDPRLPAGWDRLRFRVEVRGQRLEVDMTPRRHDLHAALRHRPADRAPRRAAAGRAGSPGRAFRGRGRGGTAARSVNRVGARCVGCGRFDVTRTAPRAAPAPEGAPFHASGG